MMQDDLQFTIPTDPEENILRFLRLPEGPQRILLAAIKMGIEQQGHHNLQPVLDALRQDSRTQALIHRLETTKFVEPPKSKAHKRR